MDRRRFLKYAGATAAVAYGFTGFPLAFGQEGSNEIDCGTVLTVPTFTGVVDQSWIGDTNDYKAIGSNPIPGGTRNYMEGHLRTKFDEYAWFAMEIPTSTHNPYEPSFEFYFDIDPAKDIVYNLVLDSGPNGLFESDHTEDSYGTKVYNRGTAFFKVLNRGSDYDWKYAFAPSETYSKPHPQLNVKIRTDILRKPSNELDFWPEYIDSNGVIYWLSGTWGTLRFIQQALPEFGLKEAVVATALGAGLVAAKAVKSKKEWSRREFLRFSKAITESQV